MIDELSISRDTSCMTRGSMTFQFYALSRAARRATRRHDFLILSPADADREAAIFRLRKKGPAKELAEEILGARCSHRPRLLAKMSIYFDYCHAARAAPLMGHAHEENSSAAAKHNDTGLYRSYDDIFARRCRDIRRCYDTLRRCELPPLSKRAMIDTQPAYQSRSMRFSRAMLNIASRHFSRRHELDADFRRVLGGGRRRLWPGHALRYT